MDDEGNIEGSVGADGTGSLSGVDSEEVWWWVLLRQRRLKRQAPLSKGKPHPDTGRFIFFFDNPDYKTKCPL
jgi:hypothetical protein